MVKIEITNIHILNPEHTDPQAGQLDGLAQTTLLQVTHPDDSAVSYHFLMRYSKIGETWFTTLLQTNPAGGWVGEPLAYREGKHPEGIYADLVDILNGNTPTSLTPVAVSKADHSLPSLGLLKGGFNADGIPDITPTPQPEPEDEGEAPGEAETETPDQPAPAETEFQQRLDDQYGAPPADQGETTGVTPVGDLQPEGTLG